MADIVHDFPINAPVDEVFRAITRPAGLDQWWTARSSGEPRIGAEYELWFGPKYDWRATVTRCEPNAEFELTFTSADDEWVGTKVGFRLDANDDTGATDVHFYHDQWPAMTKHYRVSCYCWAMYLRILGRHIEHGETVPYERRLQV